MFAFVMMMFFAVTGIVLDHEDWFAGGDVPSTEVQGELPVALLKEPDKLMVVEALRSRFGAAGAVTTFDVNDQELRIELRGPGRRTEAQIDRLTGKTTVSTDRRGLLIRLDDLHRGKDAGTAWRFVLDGSAVLLFLGALTGIMMWFALPRRRTLGVIALVASIVICGAVYVMFVP
jgi:hypothetical protein